MSHLETVCANGRHSCILELNWSAISLIKIVPFVVFMTTFLWIWPVSFAMNIYISPATCMTCISSIISFWEKNQSISTCCCCWPKNFSCSVDFFFVYFSPGLSAGSPVYPLNRILISSMLIPHVCLKEQGRFLTLPTFAQLNVVEPSAPANDMKSWFHWNTIQNCAYFIQ